MAIGSTSGSDWGTQICLLLVKCLKDGSLAGYGSPMCNFYAREDEDMNCCRLASAWNISEVQNSLDDCMKPCFKRQYKKDVKLFS